MSVATFRIVLSPRARSLSRSYGIRVYARWSVRTRSHNAIVRPGIMAGGIINETSLRLIWDGASRRRPFCSAERGGGNATAPFKWMAHGKYTRV